MLDQFGPMKFFRGPMMKNRFALSPLTTTQSHPDGVMSEDDFNWLTYRAEGGFGLTMTCAAHVQRVGQGFSGQLGVFGEEHLEGLAQLAAGIRKFESVAIVQLHHAGMRSPKALIGVAPVGPSDNAECGARAMSTAEVETMIEAFIASAERCERAGFHGVELHGAHGYLLAQFLNTEINHREDCYGGSLENRARALNAIIDGIRERCRPDFILGLRLSPELGMKLAEARTLAQQLMGAGKIDFLDLSLFDCRKQPNEEAFKGRTLMSWFTDLDRGTVRLGCAGKVMTMDDVRYCLDEGMDFVLIGRGAIIHHDFPAKLAADPAFEPVSLPVTAEHLRRERLGPAFLTYLRGWKEFIAEPAPEPA
ncbi:NADH:flavin oxidoreductase [Phenylobacterium immobile]|uniref:NADH:flavin oxidoreductase n=1 Tax=Phenylobacterium immobile TaxID=21 RepID=UPI000A651A4A|nr:NADH:flavin oxidoreductase [Phenylobacterium immobile]